MRFVRVRRMKRIAEAAAARLATRSGDDPPAARLRAVGLLGDRMRLFQEAPGAAPPAALSDEERAQRIEAIFDRARQRRAIAQGQGGGVAVQQENH